MAIQIRKPLTASPNPTTLPKRITLTQTLRSNRTAETITIDYALDPAHDVWFQDGTAAPAKAFRRTETIGRQDQVATDRITLVVGPGQGPQDLVTITETITDAAGGTLPGSVLVQLQR